MLTHVLTIFALPIALGLSFMAWAVPARRRLRVRRLEAVARCGEVGRLL
jgi:hypothetical protein